MEAFWKTWLIERRINKKTPLLVPARVVEFFHEIFKTPLHNFNQLLRRQKHGFKVEIKVVFLGLEKKSTGDFLTKKFS